MPSLELVRKLLNMTDVSIEEVASHFSRFVNEDGCLDPPSFNAGFRRFVSKSAEQDLSQTRAVLHKLFELFDSNQDGTVDFAELMAGLSVVCGGSRDQKVETAFSLFGTWTFTYTHTYAHTYMHTHIRTQTNMHTNKHAHTGTCTH